eukprot:GILI01079659.1.p2 GENE.GILI01079659.1~~GILI01079659.1.p2  ORF type:complete len:127 (-),score=33.39 GILI01079659.1:62-442(-)
MASNMPAILERIVATPMVRQFVQRFSEPFREASGYRKYGLNHEDLLMESEVVQEAIARLPEKELQERHWRIARAFDASTRKATLAKDERTKAEHDKVYLTQLIHDVEQEQNDLIEWDNDYTIPARR